MPSPLIHSYGSIPTVGRTTATGGTAFAALVRPYANQTGNLQSGTKTPVGVTHITTIRYEAPATNRHLVTVMRPLNYTTFTADAAASQAVVNVAANPGSYSTAFNYPTPAGVAPRTANNLLAANDYVAYQAADGTWVLDTVASIATLAVTLTTNLPTGGVKAGGLLYHFGISTDTDPSTGATQFSYNPLPAASGTASDVLTDPAGVVAALHPGDPLIIYSDNNTTAGYLQAVAGFYGRH